MKTPIIEFKTKVRKLWNAEGTEWAPYIEYKRTVSRIDCNLRPIDHNYYNSDMFPAMLNGAYRKVIHNREWCELSKLPPGVAVDTSKFLAVVTVTLPENFR